LRHQAGLSRVFCSCLAFTVQHYYNLTRLAPPTRSDLHGLCSGSTLSKTALIRYLHCRLQQQTAMVGSVGLALISWLETLFESGQNGLSSVFEHRASMHVLATFNQGFPTTPKLIQDYGLAYHWQDLLRSRGEAKVWESINSAADSPCSRRSAT
jgi:hypothetical protein